MAVPTPPNLDYGVDTWRRGIHPTLRNGIVASAGIAIVVLANLYFWTTLADALGMPWMMHADPFGLILFSVFGHVGSIVFTLYFRCDQLDPFGRRAAAWPILLSISLALFSMIATVGGCVTGYLLLRISGDV